MKEEEEIASYLSSQPEPKQSELRALHGLILREFPGSKLWFSDGRNSEGKVVSNPNIGYGSYTIKYADGSSREFYRVGLSGNKSGISVYVLGLEDKNYLVETVGKEIGKASVTGYCIRFKTTKDVDLHILLSAVRFGLERP